jgi:hypothetical protein
MTSQGLTAQDICGVGKGLVVSNLQSGSRSPRREGAPTSSSQGDGEPRDRRGRRSTAEAEPCQASRPPAEEAAGSGKRNAHRLRTLAVDAYSPQLSVYSKATLASAAEIQLPVSSGRSPWRYPLIGCKGCPLTEALVPP